MELTDRLMRILQEKGAKLAGAGSMQGIVNCAYPVGVSIAMPLPRHVIRDLQTAPTREYHELYHTLNRALNEAVLAGEAFLREAGYSAYAQTTDRVQVNEQHVSPLPHKTVATRAGLGWIGKNCLLVTREYGSAVRLSSLLTDAPLRCNQAIERSECGSCTLCVKNCPAQALHGALWQAGMEREKLVDVEKCYQKQLELMYAATGLREDLCGRCFAVCAYTQKYLHQA